MPYLNNDETLIQFWPYYMDSLMGDFNKAFELLHVYTSYVSTCAYTYTYT